MTRGSISQHIADVHRGGCATALERICDRYYEQLAALAGRRLQNAAGRVVDRHAVANEALYEFFDRAQRGDFENINSRGDLLPLLIRLTRDRVTDEIRRLTAKKRGGGQTRGNSIFQADDFGAGFDTFPNDYETASTRHIVMEEVTRVLNKLPDEMMRTILILRNEGYKNEEIARELDVSLATVERKRRRMRDILGELEPQPDTGRDQQQ